MTFGTTPKGDVDNTPLGSVYVPGTSGSDLTALEGINASTDINGQKSAAVRIGTKANDIADLATLLALTGTSGDANTVASLMGRLTKIRDLLIATLTISGTVTETNSSSIKSDLDEIAIDTDNLVNMKSDLDSLVTNTADLLVDGDHLATIDSGIASLITNTADLLADGDYLATIDASTAAINTATGAAGDASNASTVIGQLKQINVNLADTLTDGDHLATIDSGIASLVTATADLLADGDNLATIATNTGTVAGAVTSNKMATKAASGDFADGANVAIGTTTQTKATDGTTTSWSMVQLLKGIFDKLLGSIAVTGTFWQTTQPVSRTAVALFSTTQTNQGSGNSGDLTVGPYTSISIDVNITANAQGTNPTLQFFWERKGITDGIYYPLWQSDLIQGLPANPTAISASIGAGMEWAQALGTTGRLRWVVGGTSTPEYTFTPNVSGS